MRVIKCKCSLLLILLLVSFAAKAQQIGALPEEIIIEEPEKDDDFSIVSPSREVATIQFDESDHAGVVRAIGDLQSDIDKVTGIKPAFPLLLIQLIKKSLLEQLAEVAL